MPDSRNINKRTSCSVFLHLPNTSRTSTNPRTCPRAPSGRGPADTIMHMAITWEHSNPIQRPLSRPRFPKQSPQKLPHQTPSLSRSPASSTSQNPPYSLEEIHSILWYSEFDVGIPT